MIPMAIHVRNILACEYITKRSNHESDRRSHTILSNEDVLEIRRLWAEADINQVTLAKRYGVDHTTISKIVRRTVRKDI